MENWGRYILENFASKMVRILGNEFTGILLKNQTTNQPKTKKTKTYGSLVGNTCKSMADSCQCMAKTTTIL